MSSLILSRSGRFIIFGQRKLLDRIILNSLSTHFFHIYVSDYSHIITPTLQELFINEITAKKSLLKHCSRFVTEMLIEPDAMPSANHADALTQ